MHTFSDHRDSINYWESMFSSRKSWGSYPPESLVRFMARYYNNIEHENINVMEIGCGPGPNLWYLAREGYRVSGIDISPTALDQAIARLSSEGYNVDKNSVDLRLGDFKKLPWKDSSFDAIIDIASLYANYMKDIAETINEIKRCLKSDGMFFGMMFGTQTTGSDTGLEIEIGTRIKPEFGPCKDNNIAHFFTETEIIKLFTGFSYLNIDYNLRSDDQMTNKIFHWLVTARK